MSIAAPDQTFEASRTSRVLRSKQDGVFLVEGWVVYRQLNAVTLTMDFLFQGVSILDQSISLVLPAGAFVGVYNGSNYYNDGTVYGQTSKARLSRQDWGPVAGSGSFFQIKASVDGAEDFEIHEIGLRFKSADTKFA